ncbi:MAG: sulfurtransferase-like selenium metabolism protein YedF [Treponema sp.]|jgi:selenium metabolism protein YedF|nr:sulfurtransferase-like selenium metabolism protein YedF [Treponema sp.]
MEIINVLGKPCPIPVIEAKKALRQAQAGSLVQLVVDNDIARQNLEKMAQGMGCPFSYEVKGDGSILVTITATAAKEGGTGSQGDLVIAIGKNTLGSGNDELGAILMKAFIYALSELDKPPSTLLFFNSGVYLTNEASSVLSDLKTLEAKGTGISSCGTCLDFYHLKERLAVGTVTNMYAIVAAMANAGTLINL